MKRRLSEKENRQRKPLFESKQVTFSLCVDPTLGRHAHGRRKKIKMTGSLLRGQVSGENQSARCAPMCRCDAPCVPGSRRRREPTVALW